MYNIYEALAMLEAANNSDFMTREEKIIKKKLILLLRKSHHNKYADRLDFYDLNIVEIDPRIGGDPNFTAAISMTKPIIYLSRGFLMDEATFYQLNMLMRHELAHNLMQHELRMKEHLSPELYKQLEGSKSFHDLLNIVMDDEISNKRYSNEDKRLCRNLKLGGKVIMGLVTEDHREDWKDLKLEKMYERATKELEEIRQDILAKRAKGPASLKVNGKDIVDPIHNAAYSIFQYVDEDTPGNIFGFDCGKDIKSSKTYKQLAADPQYRETVTFIDNLINILSKNSEKSLKNILHTIASSELTKALKIKDVTIRTPEQKLLATQIIKYLSGNSITKPVQKIEREYHSKEYLDMYNNILRKLADDVKNKTISINDLNEILDMLSDKGIVANQTSYGSISKEDYDLEKKLGKKRN